MWWKSLASLAGARHRPDNALSQAEALPVRHRLANSKPIQVVGVGVEPPDFTLLAGLAAALGHTFKSPCDLYAGWLDVAFAFDARRGQYYATAILERMAADADGSRRVIGITPLDLFVPVLTFVFGEAQLEGDCAVVSYARLSEQAYGLPGDSDIIRTRLVKEAVHELGHTFGLRHCDDWRCVMASSHSVERLDTKGAEFCPRCGAAVSRTS